MNKGNIAELGIHDDELPYEVIPGTEDLQFKEKFIERYSKLTDFPTFKKWSLSFLRRSIRVNTLKISVEELRNALSRHGHSPRFRGA